MQKETQQLFGAAAFFLYQSLIYWQGDSLFELQPPVADDLRRFVRRDHAILLRMRAVNGEKIHRAAAVRAELAENDPSVCFEQADIAVRELGAPPEIRRAALSDPRRERIVRDRNGKIGVRALRHGDTIPEHSAHTRLSFDLIPSIAAPGGKVKEAEKRKAKIALSVADAGIVW